MASMRTPFDQVFDIALMEIEQIENPNVKQFGMELLTQWMRGEHRHFCKEVFEQRLEELSEHDRGNARTHMSHVKDEIAEWTEQNAVKEFGHRKSVLEISSELKHVYEVIERVGRGTVFFGSARTAPGEPDYEDTKELGRETFLLLGSPTWTGAGPGQMEAPHMGAHKAGGKIGGIKIDLSSQDSARFEQDVHALLPEENVAVCKFFAPRKVGLVDAAMRHKEEDRTAFIFTPGGFGTLDELFEYVVLKQLKKDGSECPVPVLVMNYRGFYDNLLKFLWEECVRGGKISPDEMSLFHICRSNEEALDILADTYNIPEEARLYKERLNSRRTVSMPITA